MTTIPTADAPPLPRAERYAAGRARRHAVGRQAHAAWQAAPDRANPVAVLEAQGATRIAELLPVRYARMRASPLAFLRGGAAIMAADLADTPSAGFVVQSCGDCHLANFGSYASAEGVPVFDINDFDETLPAPFEWDVKRLATSLVLAGREGGLGAGACERLAIRAVRAYAQEVARLAALSPLAAWGRRIDLPEAIETIADHRARRRARLALQQRLGRADDHFGLIDSGAPAPRLREKPLLVMRLPAHETASRQAFARYVATLPAERRMLLERYRLQDVVFKVVGVGSVGTFCAIGLFTTADGEPLLLQIKEAQRSVLEPFAGRSAFDQAGERVVTGQRVMQAASDLFLGWTRAGGQARDTPAAAGRQFYVRHLKDARLAAVGAEIEQDGLAEYAALCGHTLGRAHARSADLAGLAGYLGHGRGFAEAIAAFARRYADQTERDWALFTEGQRTPSK